MKRNYFRSPFLVFFVIGLFGAMVSVQAMPSTARSDSFFLAQDEENDGASSRKEDEARTAAAAELNNDEGSSFPMVKEKTAENPKVNKKRKFPWLLVVAGAVVAGAALYFFLFTNKKYTLTTKVGTGVNGSPAAGSVKFKRGSVVNYSYSTASGYQGLSVTLDGNPVAASGTLKMDKDHTLIVSAVRSYILTVTKSAGVDGSPATGNYPYPEGASVNYCYALSSGYAHLVVKVDNAPVASYGTITMNGHHALTASAALAVKCKLTVISEWGWWRLEKKTPDIGEYYFNEGTQIYWSCTGKSTDSSGLVIFLNGVTLFNQYGMGLTASGSFILNGDSVLSMNSH